MPQRTCTMPECSKPHRARGLCLNHYNVERYADVPRHPKHPVACSQCGTIVYKTPAKRYSQRYCSMLCRGFSRFGPMSTPVPKTHPSRQTSCTIPMGHPARPPRRAVKVPKKCLWCDADTAGVSYCDITCRRRAKLARRKGREADGHTYSWAHVMRVFALLGNCCAYCRQPVDGLPDPDHVVPLSRGGSNGSGNILPSCRLCNSDKRDLLLWEWDVDRTARNKPPVRTIFDRSDPAFAHLLPDCIASMAA